VDTKIYGNYLFNDSERETFCKIEKRNQQEFSVELHSVSQNPVAEAAPPGVGGIIQESTENT